MEWNIDEKFYIAVKKIVSTKSVILIGHNNNIIVK